jgi:hypothetical protein
MFLPNNRSRAANKSGHVILLDKKTTMDFSFVMAAYANRTVNHEARSALPDAPVVAPPPPSQQSRSAAYGGRRLAALKGWLARRLHQAAWAIEPDRRAVTGPTYLSATPILSEDRRSDTKPGSR